MPLPLILYWGCCSGLPAALSVKKAYDGHQDKSLADDIIERSKNRL